MPAILFRCLTTGLQVNGWVADDPSKYHEKTYLPMSCPACGDVHHINPKTGKSVGENLLANPLRAAAAEARRRARAALEPLIAEGKKRNKRRAGGLSRGKKS
jgi:hypothetical protein